MRDFRDETERAVWAAAFVRGPIDLSHWESGYGEKWADYVLDMFRGLTKTTNGPLLHEVEGKKLLDEASRAVRRLAARMPKTPPAGECGDHSRLYYENLAAALDEWRKTL